jgi:SAM-dependent methyltransferase
MTWFVGARHRRAQPALVRQLLYQRTRSKVLKGHEAALVVALQRKSDGVRRLIEHFTVIPARARVLEVGSGSHGLIFYFNSQGPRVGIDPLAVDYARLFPSWQGRARTCAASGEALPFPAAVFDVVLCDNVVDHAEQPDAIVREIGRVLKPHGVLYFTVNVHHPVYRYASWVHAAWNAAGVRFEIAPFADHTVHLTLHGARRMLRRLPVQIVMERNGIAAARAFARIRPVRHLGDRLKRFLSENALYEVVAVKRA